MAIEDAASLGVMLPLGTKPEQIHERLQLYQQCRRDRAHLIQDMSRKNSPIGNSTVERETKGESCRFDLMDDAGRCVLTWMQSRTLRVGCLGMTRLVIRGRRWRS